MAIVNPKPSDFKNAQKHALDYQQYRSTSDVLRAVAQFYKVSVFKSTDDKPLYYITSGLETSVNVTDDKIQITVNKGSAVIDNQPIVFLDDFIFEFDKPSVDTTYYVYLRYKYVEEYPPNYAYIEIYTNPVNSDGYYTLVKINYKVKSNTFTIDNSTYKEMRAKDIALKEESETSDVILTARANEIESVLIDLNETVNSEEIVNIIKKYDGEGSGLDADLLDGKQAADFADKYLSNVADIVLLNKIKKVDGSGSRLNADMLDGKQAADFADNRLSNVVDSDILEKIKNVDGEDSGLDADLVRGLPADFTSSKNTNGYQKLPSGLIIQWGDVDIDGGSTVTVTFPIAFPSNALQVYTTSTSVDGNEAETCVLSFTSTDADLSTDQSQTVRWLAIGY